MGDDYALFSEGWQTNEHIDAMVSFELSAWRSRNKFWPFTHFSNLNR